MITAQELRDSNLNFEKSLCYPFARGIGLGADFVGLLKMAYWCQRKGIRLCLQEIKEARGFAVERGWCDYFRPVFPELRLGWLGTLNRSAFPVGRIPVVETIARVVLQIGTEADYFIFDDLSKLPDRASSREPRSETEYWAYMQSLARALWQYNERTGDAITKLVQAVSMPSEYVAIHVRRGDKRLESPPIEVERYVSAVEQQAGSTARDVYVATDDNEAYIEVRKSLGKKFVCHRNRDFFASGYDQHDFNRSATDFRRRMTVAFLFDVQMIVGARLFVGASTSNVFALAQYLRANKRLVDVL